MNVLITGGTGGIGFAVAEHFGRLGHHVILADINSSQLDSRQQELTAAGYQASSILLNLMDQSSIEACAQAYQIDILINNAGVQHVARLEDFPEQKWQQLLQVMLTGPAMLTKALLPRMQQQGFGRVINIGSIHALVASPFKSAYVAAKHGLLGFSKVVALENADFNFTGTRTFNCGDSTATAVKEGRPRTCLIASRAILAANLFVKRVPSGKKTTSESRSTSGPTIYLRFTFVAISKVYHL